MRTKSECNVVLSFYKVLQKKVGLRQYIRNDVLVSQLDKYTDKDSRLNFYIETQQYS